MQKVAAYLLERNVDLNSPEARKVEGDRIISVIEAWLQEKGATSTVGAGTYVAVDRSDARYRVVDAWDADRYWKMFELTEVTNEGRKFVTAVSVTCGSKNVFVFATMEVGSTSTLINRINVDPKCPKVIRELLQMPGEWHHGATQLRVLSEVSGFTPGVALADDIRNNERAIPYVVVSRVNGQSVLPGLDMALARDLAGLANVYTVDEDACWALTDELRRPLSCYGGAIRIYWPRLAINDDPFRHQLWTALKLQGIEADPQAAINRIRGQFRRYILNASASSVVRPSEIDEIRGASAKAEYADLQEKAAALEELVAKAKSVEEFREIAEAYASHNDTLRYDLAERDSELEGLREELRRVEADKQALIYQLGQARASAEDVAEVEPDVPESDEEGEAPKPGEVRFYKKKYSTPAHDVMMSVADCGHSAWQHSAGADKARKGIIRHENRNREWRTMQHCGSCTGGGDVESAVVAREVAVLAQNGGDPLKQGRFGDLAREDPAATAAATGAG